MPVGGLDVARAPAGQERMGSARYSDARLALLLGLGLFVVIGWPLLFLKIPPYQDLPGHLAAVAVLANPDLYPELVPTGFLKPNSLFFVWTLFVGRTVGFTIAAKMFVLAVLAANAFVLPRFVLHFTDRRRMVLATPFLVPMIHNWFVSMGMLNFAASIPVTLLLVMALHTSLEPPVDGRASSRARAKGTAVGLALLSWYLHPFPVLVVGLIVAAAAAAELADTTRGVPVRARFTLLRATLPPLVPAALLAAFVLMRHVAVAGPKMESPVYSSLNWALYNIWSQWMYGFTELTAVSLFPAFLLAGFAVWRWRVGPKLLGPVPLLVLLLAYLFGPYVAFDANYITPRLVPFLWAAALVRIPEKLPRPLTMALGVAAGIYAIGMSIDLFRLSRELDEFAAGTVAVPEGARLLPLSFNARVTSKNTFSLGTAWGLYVLERHTSAIDAWANVPSMPIMYRKPLPTHLEPMTRLRFIKNTASREHFCAARRTAGLLNGDCGQLWRAEWDHFWTEALPSFDYVLLWAPPADVVETVPSSFHESFAQGRLHIFARTPPTHDAVTP